MQYITNIHWSSICLHKFPAWFHWFRGSGPVLIAIYTASRKISGDLHYRAGEWKHCQRAASLAPHPRAHAIPPCRYFEGEILGEAPSGRSAPAASASRVSDLCRERAQSVASTYLEKYIPSFIRARASYSRLGKIFSREFSAVHAR